MPSSSNGTSTSSKSGHEPPPPAPSAFTFVTSATPRLSKDEAKLMRAHVTRTNFAERRKRLNRVTRDEPSPPPAFPPVPCSALTQPVSSASNTHDHYPEADSLTPCVPQLPVNARRQASSGRRAHCPPRLSRVQDGISSAAIPPPPSSAGSKRRSRTASRGKSAETKEPPVQPDATMACMPLSSSSCYYGSEFSSMSSHSPASLGSSSDQGSELHLSMTPSDTEHSLSLQFLLSAFRPILRNHCLFHVSDRDEDDSLERWFGHIQTEPALMEACLAVALRFSGGCTPAFGPDSSEVEWWERWADDHAARAARLISERLNTGLAGMTDAVLGAVFTLAFRGQIHQHQETWEFHINGLMEIGKVRTSMGMLESPQWLTDMLVYDSIHLPRYQGLTMYRRIVQQAHATREAPKDLPTLTFVLKSLREITESLGRNTSTPFYFSPSSSGIDSGLCTGYEPHQQHHNDDRNDMDDTIHHLLEQARKCMSEFYLPITCPLSLAITIYIHFLWPRSPWTPDIFHVVAEQMVNSLGRFKLRICPMAYLMVWQLSMGIMASREGSKCKQALLARLSAVCFALSINTWDQFVEVLDKEGMKPPERLQQLYEDVWYRCAATIHPETSSTGSA